MTRTKITLRRKTPEQFRGDLLIYCVLQQKNDTVKPGKGAGAGDLRKALTLGDFKGEEGDRLLLYGTSGKRSSASRILYLGFGKIQKKSKAELFEQCRQAGGRIAKIAKELKAGTLCICLPVISGLSAEHSVESIIEGILLGDYRFDKYQKKEGKKKRYAGISKIAVWSAAKEKSIRNGVHRAQRTADAACSARDMANEPGNGWTPASFAAYARSLAKDYGMQCTVFGKAEMKRMKMGGILGVNQGSAEAPKMIVLEYRSQNPKAQTVLLVGKGLTFDSGGVSLKPGAGMQDMKYDMCGGAAAICTMAVVGAEKPDVNVIAIIPSTDNMPGGSALKPGDIIKHFGGTTSEIINTDAEGRLILADALAYGIKKYSPDCVVDLATLTGAVITGLGHHRTGLLGNNQLLIKRLSAAGEKSGEPLWQLPLDKEYVKQIDSDVADIKNTGGPAAGTITAAAYLQKFVGDTPWAHMDIAGTAWGFTKREYIPKGPSGTGVRTLLAMIRDWKKF